MMARPMQLEFDWKYYGHQYVKLLEQDLSLERERSKELREDLKFYRGKCERLELSMAQLGNPAQQSYADRAERVERPAAARFEQLQPPRKRFSDLKREWNTLSAEQQEKIVATGTWDTEEVDNAGQ